MVWMQLELKYLLIYSMHIKSYKSMLSPGACLGHLALAYAELC